ncbi:MAG TPA: DegV family protein [Anaerolineae bacterium]|nr:DegV family protein [Anaerolineae bacterium]
MPKIAFVSDTDSSLPEDMAARYYIQQVPITVQFGEESFLTGVDIDDTMLFERIDQEHKLPSTAAPSPGQFLKAYESALADGAESILCFTVSSAVSATYNNAVNAQQLLPGCDITVVDTHSLSLGQGFMVSAAAEAAQQGASKEDCLRCAQDVGQRVHLFAALATLKYLAMSGRVGSIAAGMAGLLSIKPILTIQDGKLELLERIRTQKKAWQRTIELTEQAAGGKPIERMGIVHVAALQAAKDFEQLLRASLDCPTDILVNDLTPGLSVHTGTGLVGVAIVVGQ